MCHCKDGFCPRRSPVGMRVAVGVDFTGRVGWKWFTKSTPTANSVRYLKAAARYQHTLDCSIYKNRYVIARLVYARGDLSPRYWCAKQL
jgi:hypothetical protein